MFRTAVILTTVALLETTALLEGQATIPTPYQATYNTLSSQIASFDTSVKAGYNGTPYPFLASPGLLPASSDNYTTLLNSTYYQYNVTPVLNAFQALGSKAVDVHINFPILYQPFYTSIGNSSQYQQFVTFYQQLVQDVHARGMKLIVECGAGSLVPGTQIANFQSYMAGLSWNDYMNGRAQNALNVAQLIQPDYLSVITEPDTEASTAGQSNAGTLSGATQMLQTILTTIQNAGVKNVQIGAGTGTWMSSYSSWVQSFLGLPINFLDMHVIPAVGSDLANAITGAQMAIAAGKQVGVTETWIMKSSTQGSTTQASMDALNAFSFWAPLDTAFLQAMADFGHAQKITFISPSWTTYFFTYLDYNTYGSLPPSTLMPDVYGAAGDASDQGSFTSTALAWENATIPAPDTSAPTVPGTPSPTSIGINGIQMSWAPSADNIGVAGYRLLRNGTLLTSVNGTSYSDMTCSPGVTYSYNLIAFDSMGNSSALSGTMTATTINNIPPSVPTNLTVVTTTKNSVTLTWTPSTGSPFNYRVLRGTSPTSLTNHAIVTTMPYTDTGVAPSTTYYYEVQATNVNGYSSGPSNEVSATTLAAH